MKHLLSTAAIAASVFAVGTSHAADPIKIAHVYDLTGALQAYAKQLQTGLELGFQYSTNGSNQLIGRDIEIIQKDSQLKGDLGKSLLEQAYRDDKAALAIGPVSSGVAKSMAPVAKDNEKILIVEGASNAITGADYNRYIFRVARNSSQDAASNAAVQAGPGVCIATLAQDYSFGREGAEAYKAAAIARGAKVVHEEYAPIATTDFTAPGQRIFDAMKDRSDCKSKKVFIVWAGAVNPFAKMLELKPERFNIQLVSGGNILPALVLYKDLPGMEGATYYYYESANNPVNDWLVTEHYKKFNSPPDFFTTQGMAEAMFVTAMVNKAKSVKTDDLIEAAEGLTFDSPKGKMTIRKQDHQAMQDMYGFKIKVEDRNNWFADGKTVKVGVPALTRVITAKEMDIPVLNKR